ncbi:MAG: UDP-N-acetylmuramoylalanyl-D-glutamate--2,6-diaminopimelate ligase, partial [Chitinophagia bacterium]|nr:UDP-N-acetylmuramoylalanyl-D-glutamate--2,6-diaminopimelate ligase [Chitinophagia bacterium]
TIIHTQLVGDYNFANVMAAVAVGRYFGIPMDNIVQAIGAYSPDNSRSQWLTRGTNHIILDAYNANPTSMRAAIINFAQLDLPAKSLWLGGMKEMGADEAAEHSALVELIANYSWQQVILVGQEFSAFAKDYLWFPDSGSAATYIGTHQPEGSNILIKGSRGSKMEIMLAAVQG